MKCGGCEETHVILVARDDNADLSDFPDGTETPVIYIATSVDSMKKLLGEIEMALQVPVVTDHEAYVVGIPEGW